MNKLLCLLAATVLSLGLVEKTQAAQPWSPAETNTWAWWDPSSTANLATNASGGVTTMFDSSGNGRIMVSSAGKEPSAFTRMIGTQYALDYVKADTNTLGRPTSGWNNLGTNGEFAIYAVFDYDSDSRGIVNFQDDLYFKYDSVNPYGKRASGGLLPYSGGPYTNPAIFNANFHWNVSGALPDSYYNAYLDAVKVGANTAYTNQLPVTTGAGKLSLMADNNTIFTMDGALGEVIIVEDTSDASRQIFEGYLAWKWGLQDNLPEDHPYEKRAPGLGPSGTVVILK